jgi:hypothetical protein
MSVTNNMIIPAWTSSLVSTISWLASGVTRITLWWRVCRRLATTIWGATRVVKMLHDNYFCDLEGNDISTKLIEKLDGPAVSALCVRLRKLSNVRKAPACFGRHVEPLVPAAFALVNTHQPVHGPRGGLWPVLLMCNT